MNCRGYVYIYTIGCQMNVYDSEKLAGILSSSGFKKTMDFEKADIIVCNTCSIRHKAEEKAFSFLGRSARVKKRKPHLITIMAGCVAQQEGEKAFDRIPHLDIVIGTHAFSRFSRHIESVRSGKGKIVDIKESQSIYEFMPDVSCPDGKRILKFVTVMEGCDNYCTYCVVPYVRGRERSRSSENIIREINLLSGSGMKEVTLLGQNVNSYGQKDSQISFSELLERVNRIKGIKRIRFATSHPKDLSSDLIYAIRDLEKVCGHVHLPVQSGSDRILKKMNRGYTVKKYISQVEKLKRECPSIALSTDIITGFPSESKEDFNDTMTLLREVEFDSIFAFVYSNRSPAPAAKFKDQIDEKEKSDRLNEILQLQKHYTEKKNKELVGKTLEVLVEGKSLKKREGYDRDRTEQMTGRTRSNKIVHFPGENINTGDIVDIKIENAYPHSLWGCPLAGVQK